MTSRTLVVHVGGIGDFLLACPAIRHVSERSVVHLLGDRERVGLAVAGGIAEECFDLSQVEFHTLFSTPSSCVRKFLASYDRAVVWMKDEDGSIDGAFRDCGIGDRIVCDGLPPDEWGEHATDYYLSCVGGSYEKPFLLSLGESDRKHDVVIHPGSGDRSKNWPLDRFLDLSDLLTARGRTVEWCLGPAESEDASLRERIPEDGVLEEQSLLALASDLQGANLYIGNDSGITHLAAAVNCPTIALFGPTDPTVWGPKGAVVLGGAGPSEWPSISSVIEAAAAHLPMD